MLHYRFKNQNNSNICLATLLWLLFTFIPFTTYTQDPATLPVEMVYVEGGSFTMGCVEGRDDINELDCNDNEFPAHTVTLRDFYIGKYEVTQGQYQAIMGDNPSNYTACGLDCPVEQVNWYATIIFCNELDPTRCQPKCHRTLLLSRCSDDRTLDTRPLRPDEWRPSEW